MAVPIWCVAHQPFSNSTSTRDGLCVGCIVCMNCIGCSVYIDFSCRF